MNSVCEASARDAGWFDWFGVWLHTYPDETLSGDRPPYFIGTVRDLCLMHGLNTGDTTL